MQWTSNCEKGDSSNPGGAWGAMRIVLFLAGGIPAALFSVVNFPSLDSVINLMFLLVSILGITRKSWVLLFTCPLAYAGGLYGHCMGSGATNVQVHSVVGVVTGLAFGYVFSLLEKGPSQVKEKPRMG